LKEKAEKMGKTIIEEVLILVQEYTVNPDLLKPRLPDEILYKLYKLRLA
jgi:hypothetical protein